MGTTENAAAMTDADKLKERNAKDAAEEAKLNEGRTGKGLRFNIGYTRGKGSQRIQYEAFDDSKPETLPATLSEFMELTNVKDEKSILGYVIEGFNLNQYRTASDPIAEFVNPAWSDETQKQFRLVVRNYANATGVSIEDAVNLIKPGIEASEAAKKVKA